MPAKYAFLLIEKPHKLSMQIIFRRKYPMILPKRSISRKVNQNSPPSADQSHFWGHTGAPCVVTDAFGLATRRHASSRMLSRLHRGAMRCHGHFWACDGSRCVGADNRFGFRISAARGGSAAVFFRILAGRKGAAWHAQRGSDQKFLAFQFVYLWPLNQRGGLYFKSKKPHQTAPPKAGNTPIYG